MTLRERFEKAETAEEFAEICRLEAIEHGGPFWCLSCGMEYRLLTPAELRTGDR